MNTPERMKHPMNRPPRDAGEQDAPEMSPERREALARIAAWTPPLMLTLLLSPRPSAASVVNEDEGTPPPDQGGF